MGRCLDKNAWFRLCLFTLCIAISALALVWVSPDAREGVVRYTGYFFVLLTATLAVGWFLFNLLEASRARQRTRCFSKGNCGAVALSLIVGVWLLFVHAEPGFKIVMDEYILASTAANMHETREVVATTNLLRDVPGGELVAVNHYVDKRTWLYPFTVSVLHDLFGDSVSHSFTVNLLLGIGILILAYLLGRELGGNLGGAVAVLLVVSLPLIAQNASGGGMELLNMTMLATVIVCAVAYLKAPGRLREGLLSLAAVLLAYSRYESVLFILPVGIVILIGWWRSRRAFISYATILAPLLLVALGLHLLNYLGHEAGWELSRGAETAFGWVHVASNVPHALVFLFSVDGELANSPGLSALGLLGLLALPSIFYHQIKSHGGLDPIRLCIAVFVPFLLLQFVLILGFHASRLDSPFVSRYALPFYWLLIMASLCLLAHLSKQISWIWRGALLSSAIFVQAYTLSVNAISPFSRKNFAVNEQVWLGALAETTLSHDGLWIDRYLVPYVLRNTAALSLDASLQYSEQIFEQVEAGIYSETFYVERLLLNGNRYSLASEQSEAMRSRFDMETVGERSFRPFSLTRVCRIVGLKEGSDE